MSPAPRPSSTANCSNSLSSLFTLLFTLLFTWPLSAFCEFGCDLRETHATRNQQHKQVIDKIRDLSRQTPIVIVLCRYDGLRRLLAEFFENLVKTFFEQIRGV